jgi:hypothetical protein
MMHRSVRLALARVLHSRILYRRALPVVLAGLGLLATGVAQESRPQITPGERKIGKKEIGPRAIAVLRMDAKGKTALVPIAIMVDGKFWDASAYKADPIPMALDGGTVYEVEKTGSSQGLFTVNGALHSTSPNMPDPWIGTGLWVPAGTTAPKTGMKAESVPVGLDTNDGPPRLTRGASASKDTAPANPPATGSSSPPASTTSSGQTQTPAPGSSGSGQPSSGSTAPNSTGSTSTGSTSPASSTGAAPTGTASNAPASTAAPESKPTETKASDTKPAAANVPPSDSGAGGGDRPRLRRGKPVDPLPDDDIPGYSKPGAASATAAKAGAPAGPTLPPAPAAAPVQLIPAISDTSGPEPRSYAYDWLQGEESDRLKQMTAFAQEQLRAYLIARAKARIGTSATGSQAGRHKAAGKPPEAVFENVRMMPYDLWTNGQPVLIFTAEAHLPPTGWTQEGVDPDLRYSILLVAHPDLYNNLIKLYVGITDKYHLDITPRLDLIDVVDADGDGRGELLFRETSDAGSGYAIYRVTADKLWKMFDSLNPE